MPERDSSQSSGFLSGVFNFVSREIDGFITTATGGTLSDSEDPQEEPYLHGKNNEDLRGGPIRTTRGHREDKLYLQNARAAPKRRDHRIRNHRRARHRSPSYEDSEGTLDLSESLNFASTRFLCPPLPRMSYTRPPSPTA